MSQDPFSERSLLSGCELVENMIAHACCQLVLTHAHATYARLLQQLGVRLGVGSRYGLDSRIQFAGNIDHPAGGERIWHGDHQHPGPRDVGLDQHCRLGRIARDRGYLLLPQVFDQLAILLRSATEVTLDIGAVLPLLLPRAREDETTTAIHR